MAEWRTLSLIYFTFFFVSFLHSKHLAKAVLQPHHLHAPRHAPKHPHHQHRTIHSEALKRSPTLSVVIDPAKPHLNSFIRVLNPPTVFVNGHLTQVEYSCQEGDLIAVQLFLRSDDIVRSPKRVFHYDWTCSKYSHGTRRTFVSLTVPDWLAYRPDYFQPDAINAEGLELKAWIVSHREKPLCIKWNHLRCYKKAYVKAVYSSMMVPVYQRPRRNYEKDSCLSWMGGIMLNYLNEDDLLRCHPEEEIVQLVDFPVAFSQSNSGITKDLPPFQDVSLRNQQQQSKLTPGFTISTMIFILEYCSLDLCGIIHRKSFSTNNYITPLLFLTKKGQVHVQVVLEDGHSSGRLSNYKLPLRQWVRLVYKQDGSRWDLLVSKRDEYNKVVLSGSVFPKPVRYDEAEGLVHLGGSSSCTAFPGFIADTWLWRTNVIKQVPNWNSSTPVLLNKISTYFTRCDNLQQRMLDVYRMYQQQRLSLIAQRSCANSALSNLGLPSPPSSASHQPVCHPWERRPPRRYKHLWKLLRTAAFQEQPYETSLASVGKGLHQKAVQYLAERGLASIPLVARLLRQASCYGDDESSYMLGTLYAGGINVDANQDEAYLHWLVAAQEGNRLAMLALANHHYHGLNAAPNDFDFSYNYLKHLADVTVKDRERHDPNGVLTEFVRLTDPGMLRVHKGEDGDHFLWLKYQAKKGIAQAQLDMARILFWGQRGVERNIQQAIELYGLYLVANPEDEVAQYDYGIIHLRGQGTEKNVQKALEHLNKSAELGHAPAYTALGWYAINFQKDMAKAAKYFDIADRMGHKDAMHNLGYMYKAGRYPGKPADQAKALWYFQKAADRGHIDSAGVVAEIYNQGNKGMARDSHKAAFWSRLVCEQNPGIGMVLRRGLDAYIAGSWGESIIYYMMVAETGTEVAQFNLAHLCEEDHDSQASTYLRSDCVWKYYNLSSRAANPHVVSQLKMGDFHYYGNHGEQDIASAVEYYAMAAKQWEPQALFNLAYLLEEGAVIDNAVWRSLQISRTIYDSPDNNQLVMALYTRCRDAGNKDSYVPCGLALIRVQLMTLWGKHTLAVQVSSALMLGLVMLLCITSCLHRVRPRPDTSQDPSSPSPSPEV